MKVQRISDTARKIFTWKRIFDKIRLILPCVASMYARPFERGRAYRGLHDFMPTSGLGERFSCCSAGIVDMAVELYMATRI
jgi:hypothetical protein